MYIRLAYPAQVVPNFECDGKRYVVWDTVLYRLEQVPEPEATQIRDAWMAWPDPDEREVEPDHDMQLEDLQLRQQDERGER